jgi:hypothetical protein
MNRVILLEHLKEIEGYLAQGLAQIAQQRSCITELESGGRDSRKARALLEVLLETQALHEESRLRILGELAQAS